MVVVVVVVVVSLKLACTAASLLNDLGNLVCWRFAAVRALGLPKCSRPEVGMHL